MVKSGLLVGVIALFVTLGLYMLSPICTPLGAILLGLLAGYLACIFSKPPTADARMKQGALAGLIAGVGAFLGSAIGGIISGALMTSSYGQQMYTQICSQYGYAIDPTSIWTGQAFWACCLIPFNILLMTALGLAGAAIWHKLNPVRPPVYVPPQNINQP
jgi:uncharacterized membrane protein YeaQ/YmgE (transglycosylase-associated protein family)